MYTELSAGQARALETQKCSKCGTSGQMREAWGRNGLTVECGHCGEKVHRPRGKSHPTYGAGQGQPQQGQPQQDSQPQQRQGKQGQGKQQGQPQESQQEKEAREKQEREQYEQEKQELKEAMQQAVQQEVERQIEEKQIPLKVETTKQGKDGEAITSTQQVDNPHDLLAEVLRRITAGIRNFLFVGPSGSGKTTIVEQLAKALDVPYFLTPCSGGLTEGRLIGRVTANGDFLTTAFLTAYEQPAVHNFDEFDKLDPNVPACVHAAIENGTLFLPDRVANPKAMRDKLNINTATCNTWGRGADMMYVGANQIDAAMYSRFAGGVFFVDYDTKLEARLVPEQEYRENFWKLRVAVFQHKLRRIWGTRELLRGAQLLRAGYSQPEVFTALTVGFSPDEMQKLGLVA